MAARCKALYYFYDVSRDLIALGYFFKILATSSMSPFWTAGRKSGQTVIYSKVYFKSNYSFLLIIYSRLPDGQI